MGLHEKEDFMEITDIRVRKVEADGKLRAYVTVTFDDCFVVHNVKVIEGKSGTFIAMPSRKTKTGEYKDVAHPINSDFRHKLQSTILDAYETAEDVVSGGDGDSQQESEKTEV
jgi:stage V sporulation protein G